MTKTNRTNQYPRMEFKTKRAPRNFKNLFDMFTSNKLSVNIYYNNLSQSEKLVFLKELREHPNKYLCNMVLSAKQSNLIKNKLHINICKEHHCNKYYKKCYDCIYGDATFGECTCECNACYDKTGNCSICMTRIKTNALKLECSHIFHKECIGQWLKTCRKTTCPYCRNIVTPEFLTQNGIEPVIIVRRDYAEYATVPSIRERIVRYMNNLNDDMFRMFTYAEFAQSNHYIITHTPV